MMRVAIDSNLLIYAEFEPETPKGARSRELILRAASNGVIPAQALGEFLRFTQRRAPAMLKTAQRQFELYVATFVTPPTTDSVLRAAADLAATHGFQTWDAVICAASTQAGAKVLLSEDMQDGRLLGALRIINPFAAANNPDIEALFA